MEKRIEKRVAEYMLDFKTAIKDKIVELGLQDDEKVCSLLQFIYDREEPQFLDEKKKRYANTVSVGDRCIAKKSNGDKCTRRKQNGADYCGTHIKGAPPQCDECDTTAERVELCVQSIQGINNYIDKKGNIYSIEDILSNKPQPAIVGRYVVEGDVYRYAAPTNSTP